MGFSVPKLLREFDKRFNQILVRDCEFLHSEKVERFIRASDISVRKELMTLLKDQTSVTKLVSGSMLNILEKGGSDEGRVWDSKGEAV